MVCFLVCAGLGEALKVRDFKVVVLPVDIKWHSIKLKEFSIVSDGKLWLMQCLWKSATSYQWL